MGKLPSRHLPQVSALDDSVHFAQELFKRFEMDLHQADLDQCIEVLQDFLDQIPSGDPRYHPALCMLIGALDTRYLQRFARMDLERNIELQEQLLQLPQPEDFTNLLFHYGLYYQNLLRRYAHSDALTDLEAALQKLEQDYRSETTAPQARTLVEALLAMALRQHYLHTENSGDILLLVRAQEQALSFARTGSRLQLQCLQKLASGLILRYQQSQQLPDLDRAIELLEQVLQAVPPGSQERQSIARRLGTALRIRYEWSQAPTDLERAVYLRE